MGEDVTRNRRETKTEPCQPNKSMESWLMGRLQCTVAHWPKADMTVRDSDVRFSQNDVEPCSARRKYLMWSVQRWEESRCYTQWRAGERATPRVSAILFTGYPPEATTATARFVGFLPVQDPEPL